MTGKVKAAIIGSGNIGTDLMIKMIKYPQNMELVAVVGIDEKSEGLAMARERGVAGTTSIRGNVARGTPTQFIRSGGRSGPPGRG